MKKTGLIAVALLMAAAVSWAEPIRVVLLDFDNQAGTKPEGDLAGSVSPDAIAGKGVYLLSKSLLGKDTFTLIDRRDFINQIEKLEPKDNGQKTPTKPTFIHAAQALKADVILRGSLMSLSPSKQVVNQGGIKTEFNNLALRVAIEALDPVDGSVIAMADGVVSANFRQTDQHYSVLSEEDVIDLMGKAIADAVPTIEKSVESRQAKAAARPKIKLSVKTSADPALLEVDGILVATTPVENLEIYQGDHVMTVGKAGYRDVTKRIMFDKSSSIEVPMLRTELSADEWKSVLEKARLNILNYQPDLIIHTTSD